MAAVLGGKLTSMNARVTVARGSDPDLAAVLHDSAGRLCFIANSCASPVRHLASVEVEER